MNKALILSILIPFQFSLAKPSYSSEASPLISFTDVEKNHWAYNTLKELIEQYNFKIGYPDNTFKGDKEISRYEVAALLLQVLKMLPAKRINPEDKEKLENISNQYSDELSFIKEQLQSLQEQNDINDTKIDQITDNLEQFNQVLTFKLFGSIAFRHCIMSTNIFTEPQNIIKNLNGNNFQTRIGGGITGNVVNDFNYQLRILTIEPNSFNLPWLPVGSNLIRLPFYFDRFSIAYKPKVFNNSINSLQFTVGKANNFMSETELLFDEDISFNGLSQQYSLKFPTGVFRHLFLGLTENVLSNDGPFIKTVLLGGKIAGEINPVDKLTFRAGTSYSGFIGSENLAKFQFSPGFLGPNSLINRLDSSNNVFKSNFNLLDAFLKITYKINDKLPLAVFADFVNNFGAADQNKGYLIGASLGELKEAGDLFFNYNYKFLSQDYNLAFFVQDEMGGTDVKGHEFDFGIQVAQKTSLQFTLQNRSSISKPNNPDFYILYSTIRQDF